MQRQRLGRPPGPGDPPLVDPGAEAPTPIDDLVAVMESREESAVIVKAWRDLGYIVTTENRHTFSEAEIQAWERSVAAHEEEELWLGYDDYDEQDDEEMGFDELLSTVDGLLRVAVGGTLTDRSAEPARSMSRRITSGGNAMAGWGPERESVPSVACAVAVGWLVGARDRDPGVRMAADAIAWLRSEVGPGPAESASRAGALLDASSPVGADLTVAQLADELCDDFLPALLWLCAGAVARFGSGNPDWLPAPNVVEPD